MAHTQDAPTATILESWPTEKHCIEPLSERPAGWTYPGTIIYRGSYGLHGLRADWPTSRVMTFTNIILDNGGTPGAGSFSPDGKRYAAPMSTGYCNALQCQGFLTLVVTSLRIFEVNHKTPRAFQSFDWDAFYTYDYRYNLTDAEGPMLPIWLDNERVVYMNDSQHISSWVDGGFNWALVDSRTGKKEPWTDDSETLLCFYCSPDATRDIQWVNRDTEQAGYRLIDRVSRQPIANVQGDLPFWEHTWSPDSQWFITYDRLGDESSVFYLYDRQGQLSSILLKLTGVNLTLNDVQIKWSPDSRYVLIQDFLNRQDPLLSHLFDLKQGAAVDLCSRIDTEWSPDSRQLAFTKFENGDWSDYIAVLNIDTYQSAIISSTASGVSLWRED